MEKLKKVQILNTMIMLSNIGMDAFIKEDLGYEKKIIILCFSNYYDV